ncbi:Protein kinase [Mycena indigotica]|uniref:Protein kinase n=1 Tax=Mycena indigotica TaxID=2126181 RepID=A0A8H6W675_9AGAR|nr:Protein kinase [Mycena indigotica]KAF7307319.1 Protein kinase [Mycena indigotica]
MATPSIKLCDFSESYMPDMPDPPELGSPHILRPPEGILTDLPHATLASDIWALTVAIYQVLTSGFLLFSELDDGILEAMVLTLGKFPEPLWSKWAHRAKFFDDEGNPATKTFWGVSGTASRTTFSENLQCWTTDLDKISALAAMFESMAQYDAESRCPARDLVQSEWMTKYCRPYMADNVILPTERTKLKINTPTYFPDDCDLGPPLPIPTSVIK